MRNPDNLCKAKESERRTTNYVSFDYQMALSIWKFIYLLQKFDETDDNKKKEKNVDKSCEFSLFSEFFSFVSNSPANDRARKVLSKNKNRLNCYKCTKW